MNILVTGASGFVGSALLSHMSAYEVTALARTPIKTEQNIKWVSFDLEELLSGQSIPGEYDTVVHLAARAHILRETSCDPLAEFLKFNRDVTIELAKQMFHRGMKRFVFISSVGVNGAKTEKDEIFCHSTPPRPTTDYGKSKLAAEDELKALSQELGFELVIIRPPLVYGDNAPGNFGKLKSLVGKKLPLPFGLVKNRKSYISRANLIHFIELCCSHPNAAGQTFLISDDDSISTRALIVELAKGLNVSSILIPFPPIVLYALLYCIGKKGMAIQLLSDLRIDNSHAKKTLNWEPLESTLEALNNIHRI